MICDRCGTQVPENAQNCHNCGHVFNKTANRGTRQGTLMLRRQRKAKAIHNLPYQVGDWIDDRYKIQDVVGTGALGGVFRVTDTDMDQELALKLISKDYLNDDIIRMLRQAMRRVRKLSHTNIVRIYEEGTDQGNFYYTMPYLEGLTLSKIMDLRRQKDQYFNLQEVEPILSQMVDALEYAHTTIFHGYLKPQNIIVLPDVLKLTGFGIALALPFDHLLAAQANQKEALLYLAPELQQGRGCDARADIYSLGVILGEMLTCRNNPDDIPSIQELNPEVNPLIDVVFRRATAYYPEERYMHVADMMADIVNIIEEGELAEDDEVPTLIVGDEHFSDLPGMGSFADEADSGFGMEVNPMSMDADGLPLSATSDSALRPPPLPPEKSELIVMSASMEVEAISEEEEEIAAMSAHLVTEDEHVTIPSEMYNPGSSPVEVHGLPTIPADAHDTLPPESRPMVQFTGEKETYRLPSSADELEVALQPPPLPPGVVETNPNAPPRPPGPPVSPFGAPPMSYGDELELPLTDDDDTTPAQPVPEMGNNARVSIQEHYPENAPTIPAHVAPMRTMPVEQTYGESERIPQPAFPPDFPSPPGLESHAPYPSSLQQAHINAQVDEEETGFSRFGIFFFVLGLFLIFGAGGIALFFKFVYLPRLQLEKYKKTQQTRDLPVVPPTRIDTTPAPRVLARLPARRLPPDGGDTTPPAKRGTTVVPAALTRREPPPVTRRDPDKRTVATPARPQPRRRKPAQARRKVPPRRKIKVTRRRKPPKRRRVRVAALTKTGRSRSGAPCPKGMAYVRKGSFQMGSAKNDEMRSFGELTLKWRKTDAYCIDRYEYPGPGRRPKTSVSFYQAQKLCERQGKRLCTEQEWERACKGGRNYRYPYGNKFSDQRCNTRRKSGENRSVTSSGRYRACRSRYGIYDMSGNVAEWTSSRYRSGAPRTVRGGAANRPDWDVRCASRRSLAPSRRQSTVGFRCCADPKSP